MIEVEEPLRSYSVMFLLCTKRAASELGAKPFRTLYICLNLDLLVEFQESPTLERLYFSYIQLYFAVFEVCWRAPHQGYPIPHYSSQNEDVL